MPECDICGEVVKIGQDRLEYKLYDKGNPGGRVVSVNHAHCEGF